MRGAADREAGGHPRGINRTVGEKTGKGGAGHAVNRGENATDIDVAGRVDDGRKENRAVGAERRLREGGVERAIGIEPGHDGNAAVGAGGGRGHDEEFAVRLHRHETRTSREVRRLIRGVRGTVGIEAEDPREGEAGFTRLVAGDAADENAAIRLEDDGPGVDESGADGEGVVDGAVSIKADDRAALLVADTGNSAAVGPSGVDATEGVEGDAAGERIALEVRSSKRGIGRQRADGGGERDHGGRAGGGAVGISDDHIVAARIGGGEAGLGVEGSRGADDGRGALTPLIGERRVAGHGDLQREGTAGGDDRGGHRRRHDGGHAGQRERSDLAGDGTGGGRDDHVVAADIGSGGGGNSERRRGRCGDRCPTLAPLVGGREGIAGREHAERERQAGEENLVGGLLDDGGSEGGRVDHAGVTSDVEAAVEADHAVDIGVVGAEVVAGPSEAVARGNAAVGADPRVEAAIEEERPAAPIGNLGGGRGSPDEAIGRGEDRSGRGGEELTVAESDAVEVGGGARSGIGPGGGVERRDDATARRDGDVAPGAVGDALKLVAASDGGGSPRGAVG